MNLDQFAASFRPAEKAAPPDVAAAEAPASDVVFAATILDATRDLCRIDINGVEYEIPGDDVIDIQVIATPGPGGAAPKADTAEGDEAAEPDEGEGAEDVITGPRVALLKVKATAVLTRQVQVPAVLIAAAGTWMTLVPADCKPA